MTRTRPTVFLPGSTAHHDALFPDDQNWVGGNATGSERLSWMLLHRLTASTVRVQSFGTPNLNEPSPSATSQATPVTAAAREKAATRVEADTQSEIIEANDVLTYQPDDVVEPRFHEGPDTDASVSPNSFLPTTAIRCRSPGTANSTSPADTLHTGTSPGTVRVVRTDSNLQHHTTIEQPEAPEDLRLGCLLRYFIEEIAHWVSHRVSGSESCGSDCSSLISATNRGISRCTSHHKHGVAPRCFMPFWPCPHAI